MSSSNTPTLKVEQYEPKHNHLPQMAVGRLVGHDGPVQSIVFTADGKYCLTGGYDRTVRLWNPSRYDPAYPNMNQKKQGSIENGHIRELEQVPPVLPIQVYRDGLSDSISSLAVQYDYNQQLIVLAGSGQSAQLTDVVTGQPIRRYGGHYGRVNAVAFSNYCETLLTASYDTTVRIYDGRTRNQKNEPIQILKDAKDSVTAVHTVQSSSNSNSNQNEAQICTGSIDGIVRTYDLRMGMVRCDDCNSPIISLSRTHDQRNIIISCLDGTIRLMDCDSGELVNIYSGCHSAGQYMLDCTITANDTTVVTGSENGNVVYYDLVRTNPVQQLLVSYNPNKTSKQQHQQHLSTLPPTPPPPSFPTCAVTCHPIRSDTIITGCYDGNTIVWAHDDTYMTWD